MILFAQCDIAGDLIDAMVQASYLLSLRLTVEGLFLGGHVCLHLVLDLTHLVALLMMALHDTRHMLLDHLLFVLDLGGDRSHTQRSLAYSTHFAVHGRLDMARLLPTSVRALIVLWQKGRPLI